MNQMVANLYVNKTGTSSSTQGSTNVQMETSSKPGDEQQTKRKQSSEKSMKKVKRKRPTESSLSNDIDGRIIFSYFHIILNSIPQVLMLNIRQRRLKIFLHRIYSKKYDTISIEYNRFV
jgi:hypothetical protein